MSSTSVRSRSGTTKTQADTHNPNERISKKQVLQSVRSAIFLETESARQRERRRTADGLVRHYAVRGSLCVPHNRNRRASEPSVVSPTFSRVVASQISAVSSCHEFDDPLLSFHCTLFACVAFQIQNSRQKTPLMEATYLATIVLTAQTSCSRTANYLPSRWLTRLSFARCSILSKCSIASTSKVVTS